MIRSFLGKEEIVFWHLQKPWQEGHGVCQEPKERQYSFSRLKKEEHIVR